MRREHPQRGVHPDRVAGGDCHHRDPGGDATAGLGRAKDKAQRIACVSNSANWVGSSFMLAIKMTFARLLAKLML